MAQDSTPTRQELTSETRSAGLRSHPTPLLPGLTILAHPDLRRVGEVAALPGLCSGQETQLSRSAPTFMPVHCDAVDARPRSLDDSFLSRSPIRLTPKSDEGDIRIWAEDRARLRVGGERVVGIEDLSGKDLERGVVLLLADRVALLFHWMDPTPERGIPRYGLVGENRLMVEARRDIGRAANTEVPVLIRGATGTGKELVAHALHRASSRRSGPFVAINLGAVAPTLASAELFGVVKGAFTGADRNRLGCFERARGGTLFLDEIGEAPLEVQAHLLRALETGTILPVGGESERRVDVRLVAATDTDLEAAISSQRFREPLLHRLGGYEIFLPTLAERREDIGRLLIHFLRSELEALGERVAPEARGTVDRPWLPASLTARLAGGAWPGNVRQLRNVARRLLIACRAKDRLDDGVLSEKWLGEQSSAPDPPPERKDAVGPRSEPSAAGVAETGQQHFEARRLRTLCLAATVPWQQLSETLGPGGARDFRSRFDQMIRQLLGEYRGYEITTGENYLTLLFERPLDAVGWALEYQEACLELAEVALVVEGRAAIHVAELLLRRNTPETVTRGARVMEILEDPVSRRAIDQNIEVFDLAMPRQILMTRNAFDLARHSLAPHEPLADPSILWMEHGCFKPDPSSATTMDLFEVGHRDVAFLARPPESSRQPTPQRRSPSELSEDEVLQAMETHEFNLQSAADALGISRSSLYKLVEKSSRAHTARDLSPEEIQAGRDLFGDDLDAVARHLRVSRRGLSRRMSRLGLR